MDNTRIQDALDALDSIMADKTQAVPDRLEAVKLLFSLDAPLPHADPLDPEPVRLTTEQFNALVDLIWSIAGVVRDDSKTYGPVNEQCRHCRLRAYALLVNGEE